MGATWNIFTKPEHFEEIIALFKDTPFHLQLIEIGTETPVAGCGMIPTSKCEIGVVLLAGLRTQIHYGIKNRSRMLMAPPDTIFGDGTIPSMLAIGAGPSTAVSVAHMRVLPSVLEEIGVVGATRGAIENPHLVTLAMKHAHDSWKFAEIGHERNTSFSGGIAWKSLGPGLYSIQHRLPTPYLVDFNHADFDFFWGQVSWGGWDHRWPAENLIRQERQRYVGSSDACFIVELTEWDKNVPPEWDKPGDRGNQPDAYWGQHYHNGINRQVNVIWRGE